MWTSPDEVAGLAVLGGPSVQFARAHGGRAGEDLGQLVVVVGRAGSSGEVGAPAVHGWGPPLAGYNIVRVTSYLRDVSYAEANANARVKALGGRAVATTAIVAETLVSEWLVEIEVVAAA